ncbi:hypothetical protein BpHYR1_046681 [Brachionus plicatilis]|uniref:Uncharacterized protein n=1 Tax=Brachionus plicatilis TaxID=10195 RepID=A0A3M7RW16_BRAPC|nr:hypothetical protein BpHYR1_046681 [Brachionus plicatilis]
MLLIKRILSLFKLAQKHVTIKSIREKYEILKSVDGIEDAFVLDVVFIVGGKFLYNVEAL